MLFRLSCVIGILLTLADGTAHPFLALMALIVTFSDKAIRLVLWFTVIIGGPWLLLSGNVVHAVVAWPYCAVYLGYSLLLDRIDKRSSAHRYMTALGWLTLAVQGWVITAWIINERIENGWLSAVPFIYVFATFPMALSASFYVVRSLRPDRSRPPIHTTEGDPDRQRVQSQPAEG